MKLCINKKYIFDYLTQEDVDSIEEQITKYEKEHNCKLKLKEYIEGEIYTYLKNIDISTFDIEIIHENDKENCCFTIATIYLQNIGENEADNYDDEIFRYLHYKLTKEYIEDYD